MSKSGVGPESRLLWADAARGASVLFVVLFHVLLWHLNDYRATMWGPADRVWTKFNAVLGSLRMPLLLGVAGLVASRRILLGLSEPRNLVRAASNYYLYVVWLLIYAVYFAFVSDPALPHRVDGLADVVFQLVFPNTTLWFVYALALYVIFLSAMH